MNQTCTIPIQLSLNNVFAMLGQALANSTMDNTRIHPPDFQNRHFGPGDHSLGS